MVPSHNQARHCRRRSSDRPSRRSTKTSMTADNARRIAAVNEAPTTGTVMRWNRNEAPQIMPSRVSRISAEIGMRVSTCGVAERCLFTDHSIMPAAEHRSDSCGIDLVAGKQRRICVSYVCRGPFDREVRAAFGFSRTLATFAAIADGYRLP